MCRVKHQTRTDKWFRSQVKDMYKTEYVPLTDYIQSKIPVKMTHRLCGYTWMCTPDNFLRRHSKCPKCSHNAKRTTSSFRKELYNLFGKEYSLRGAYVNAKTYVRLTHNVCGNSWNVTPDSIKQGTKCPVCKESKGERMVREILIQNNIAYQPQYRFERCRSKNTLPFDFYLSELNVCIEYDGIQHYKPIDFASKGIEWAENNFRNSIERDKIKTDFCEKTHISLIRIPYNLTKQQVVNLLGSLLGDIIVKK